MSIEIGVYFIINKASNQPVGQAGVGDGSLSPKRIINHPQGSQGNNVKWKITPLATPGKYKLENLGAPAIEQRRLVYAGLNGETPESWIILARPQAGGNTYTIETGNRSAGWNLPTSGAQTQVNCEQLIVGPSVPANQLWVIFHAN